MNKLCWFFLLLATATCFDHAQAKQLSVDELIQRYRGEQALWPAPTIDDGAVFEPLSALPTEVIYPEDRPYSKAIWTLGKHLFFERRLSRSEQISCANCHDPDLGWADGRRKAIGHNRQQHTLNSPSIMNTVWLNEIFWNGRVTTLEEQVLQSWQNPIEMAGDIPTAVQRISSIEGYRDLFKAAFDSADVDADRISQAIATFMRSVTLTSTRFDKFMRGQRDELTDKEIRGLHLFRTKARCANCHSGALLSDGQYHHLGSSFHNVGEFKGRYSVTGKPEHVGAFRTPGLRGISATAPYFHNGIATNLDILLTLYNSGWWQNAELKNKGNDIPTATLSPLIAELNLSPDEISELKAFLLTLDGNIPWYRIPDEPQ